MRSREDILQPACSMIERLPGTAAFIHKVDSKSLKASILWCILILCALECVREPQEITAPLSTSSHRCALHVAKGTALKHV